MVSKVAEGIALMCCLAGCAIPALASDNTNINNRSQWVFKATTSYPGGQSKFVDRTILPGGTDVDTYNCCPTVTVTVQVHGARYWNHFDIFSDQSVVAVDNPNNRRGVDFYVADRNNGGPEGPLLVTIYAEDPVSTLGSYTDPNNRIWDTTCNVAVAGRPLSEDCIIADFKIPDGDAVFPQDRWDIATDGSCTIGVFGKRGMNITYKVLSAVAEDLIVTCEEKLGANYITGGIYTLPDYDNKGKLGLTVHHS